MGNTPFFTLAPPNSYTLNLKTLTKVLKVSLLDLKKWWVYVFLLFLTTETLFYQDLPKVMKSNAFCSSNHQDLKAGLILTVKSLEPINTLEIQPRQGNKTTDKSYAFKWRILTQTSTEGSGKNKKFWFFLLGFKYTLRICFESKNFLPKSCPELSNQVLSFSEGQIY